MMPPIAEWGGDMHLEGHEPHETVFDIFADGSQSLYEYPAPSSRCYRVSASFSQSSFASSGYDEPESIS